VVADIGGTAQRDVDEAEIALSFRSLHDSGESQQEAGHRRCAEPNGDGLQLRVRASPVGDEPGDVTVRREDVHEDVGGALLVRVREVVVNRHEVT